MGDKRDITALVGLAQDPAQLLLGTGHVIAVNGRLRQPQGGELGIGATLEVGPELLRQLHGYLLLLRRQRRGAIGLQHALVQVRRRLRLVLAIVLPALVTEPQPQRQDDRDQGGAAIFTPPTAQRFNLFFFGTV